MASAFVPLLCIFFTIAGAGAKEVRRPPAVFVFGDSHVDSGNNNFLLTTLSKANRPPNGIDFVASGGQPTGRFTNGRTIADIIALLDDMRLSCHVMKSDKIVIAELFKQALSALYIDMKI
ncbi:GDSL esterase/lipase [Apostasia shenzhenica]|uniref:GDSL esterase/lipase n=1 Tax=Apostasia shenzhenica TaxID=1088818 RepID=A0A2I0AQ99_9ASPA|nr:GDSL esterase/lipase [Apostasia shenzhenica]